ncbi:FxSxx-COOH system tetratricopeptide repeat protein [Streptomyces sp. NBC_01210]|uniref:FxSxx-COOH system tetratricopeptide repeat protein n=1 Tax=Streptomyces sp. NBC_01210 TaxID=2903774 RepID=UPI002E0FCC94|nr:FxSxx-COOH system tetratricopeptide repeat protein [Streptomyces sp. NBC_01210]
MNRTVYIVSDPHDKDRPLELAVPLETAGFTVVHNEAVGVGESLIGRATQHLRSGIPIVLCATVHAVARPWSRKLVNAAHAIEGGKVLVVEMDAGLYLDDLSLNTVVARYHADPAGALEGLVKALNAYFPNVAEETERADEKANTPSGEAVVDHMDRITSATTPSIEALAEFRGQLREDIAAEHPQSLSAWEFLQRTSLVRDGRLTKIGVLLVGENPAQIIPSAVVECCEYYGKDRNAASAKITVFGTLQHQIVQVNKYIADRVQRGEAPSPTGPFAEPVYAYPMIAVREIVANAVAHRDYSAVTSCIHVRLFEGRMEITNPGTWTGQELGGDEARRIDGLSGESTRRNFRLASMLTWIRLVEGEGKGILAVVADCENVGAPIPTVKESDGIITVTVFPRTHQQRFAARNGWVPATVADVAAAPGMVNLPGQTALFIGRDAEFAALDSALSASRSGTAVVHGLGGVGKSTFAAAYALQRSDSFNPVWWVGADSAASVESGLAGLTTALLPGQTSGAPLKDLAEWATAWLAAHDNWLLILDDVNDSADIRPLLARLPNGRLILTSRLSAGWHRVTSTALRLDVLEPVEAVGLLVRIATQDREGIDLEGAEDLCAELGYLPLAVEQAAAYLSQSGLTVRAYQSMLAASPARVYDMAAAGADMAHTIARTWRLSLDRLSRSPLAGRLLRILAWYGSGSIPLALLEGLEEPGLVREAVGGLAAYSMLSVRSDGAVSMHPLVQALTRTPDPDDPHRDASDIGAAHDEAIRILQRAFPESSQDPATWGEWRALLPHFAALVAHTPPEEDTRYILPLLIGAGRFLQNQGAVGRATDYFERALAGGERLLGAEHPATLAYRNDLAGAHRAAGRLERAIPLLESTLADYVRILGEDHPDTLGTRSNLAGAYRAAGNLGRAIPLFEQTVANRRRVLGEDHASTLASRNNLAGAYQEAGDLERAIPLLESTLADYVRILGEDHPDTLAAHSNLAGVLESRGDLEHAVQLYERVLADRKRVLGPDHPDTLAVSNNLAGAYESQGDVQRAVRLYERTLGVRTAVLGEDHPDTLASRNNLAGAYEAAGDIEAAIALYERTLADHERLLGSDHPDTLAVRSNLAGSYRIEGDKSRATPLYEQALADSVRVLGEDHPRTEAIRRALDPPPVSERELADRVAVLLEPGGAAGGADRSSAAGRRLGQIRELVHNSLPDHAPMRRLEDSVDRISRQRALSLAAKAIAEALRADEGLADRLRRLVDELETVGQESGVRVTASGERSIAIGGNNVGIISTGDSNTIHWG